MADQENKDQLNRDRFAFRSEIDFPDEEEFEETEETEAASFDEEIPEEEGIALAEAAPEENASEENASEISGNGQKEPEKELTREEMLARLRHRTEEESAIHSGAAYERREREKRSEKRTDLLGVVAIFLAFLCAFLFYYHNYPYATYSVDETITGNFENASVYEFADGILVAEEDSLSYYVGTQMQWTEKVSVKNPLFESKGSYFAITSVEGYYLYIGSKEGVSGSVKLSRKIRGIGISEAGATAVYTSSDEAAYISYFDRYGNRLSVELKTVLLSTGYPIRILVSPDGQKLAVLYYSIQNGIGESRLVIYDFENGRESSYYMPATVDD